MKKIYAILLCLLLVASVAVTAFAATPVEMTATPAKASVSRGETITIEISLPEVKGMTATSAWLMYDESVLEFVTGSYVGAADVEKGSVEEETFLGGAMGIALFANATDFAAGKVFTFEMKVKDAAAFGATTIEVLPVVRVNMEEVESTANKVEVEVVCAHEWSAWTKADDANCARTCSICDKTETAAHAWDAGKVTKEPTCSEAGEKAYTCETCKATKTEAIAATGEHVYETLTKVDENEHKAVCACGAEKNEAHAWDAGKVTKEPTCSEAGEKTYTCACSATKTEAIPATGEHTYGAPVMVDDKTHKATCTCGAEKTDDHVFDELVAGETTHWYACECGAKKDEAEHAVDAEKWFSDENNHWHACECGVAGTVAPHAWDEGKVTQAATTKKEGIKTYTCTECGAEKTESIPKLESPATGDEMMILPMVLLMVLSTVGVAVAVIGKKRSAK